MLELGDYLRIGRLTIKFKNYHLLVINRFFLVETKPMIGHIEHGSNFGGLFRYLLATDKGARIIGGNAAGETIEQLTQEFNNCADLRRTTTKPVKHFILSFAPEDGEVSDHLKQEIATQAIQRLGYVDNQYVVIDHHREDPGHDWNHDHDHIHIAVNMITIKGKRVDDWQDKRRFEAIIRELELEHNLTIVAPSRDRKQKALTHGQVQKYKRQLRDYQTGQQTQPPDIPISVKLQAAIDAASIDKPTMTLFIGRLQHLGIDVKPIITQTGRKRISYQMDGAKPFRGSKLHNASFPKLISQRGVNCDPQRDKQAMEDAVNHQQVTLPPEQLINWSEINLSLYLPKELDTEPLEKEKQKKTDKSLKEEPKATILRDESRNLPETKSLPLTPEFSPDALSKQLEYTLTIAPIAYRWLKANQTVSYQAKNNLIEYESGKLTIFDDQGKSKMIAVAVGTDEHQRTIWECVNLPLNSPGLTQDDVEIFTNPAMEQALSQLESNQQKHQPSQQKQRRRGR